MADSGASTLRAEALRRLAAQPRHGASRRLVASRTEASRESGVRTGLALELLLSAIATALIAMAIVATNSGTVIRTDERRPIMVVVPAPQPEGVDDSDSQKSLLFCTVTSDRTRCVQEQS